MKLSKKYFSAAFVAIGIQFTFGINLANAMQCEKEIEYQYYNQTPQESGYNHPDDGEPDGIRRWFGTMSGPSYAIGRLGLEKIKSHFYEELVHITTFKSSNGKPYWQDHEIKSCKEHFQRRVLDSLLVEYKYDGVRCVAEYMVRNNCNNIGVFKYKKGSGQQSSSNNSSSNQSSSSSSSQSHKNSNRQSANNQSSSNSSDESIKRLNEAIDQSNNAHDNKDYAKSIAAIKIILAESKDIPLKAAAANRLGEYYKDGKGVQKDEVKAQALFEQASLAGNPDADAHIGENYQDGTGGVIKNHQTAIKYFTAAAAKGHVVAMSKLGYLYHAGIGTINPELGNEWICKAAKQGDSTAIGNAANLKLSCN